VHYLASFFYYYRNKRTKLFVRSLKPTLVS